MYLSNIRGAWNLVRRRPQVVSIAALNLRRRFVHKFRGSRTNGWSHPPEQITVIVTDVCNLRCKMCQYAFTDAPDYQLNRVGRMSPHTFQKLMDEIPGHLTVSFTGGEPLLHPDVADFIAYAKGKHRLCMLTTNGWMLAKQAQALCKAGLDVLVVSVDGPKDIHNMIRGGKSFERLVGGLETILRQPKRPIVFVTMVISDLNYDKLIPMYELAKSWGTDGINFNHLWMQTDKMVAAFNSQFSIFAADKVAWEIRPKAVNVEQLADGLETIRRRSRGGRFVVTEIPYLNHQEIAVWYQKPEQFIKYDTTRCAWIRIKVWPDGKVKPCRGWQAGDIAEQQAMEVWNGQKFGDFRQTLATHGTLPICARCCYMAYR